MGVDSRSSVALLSDGSPVEEVSTGAGSRELFALWNDSPALRSEFAHSLEAFLAWAGRELTEERRSSSKP